MIIPCKEEEGEANREVQRGSIPHSSFLIPHSPYPQATWKQANGHHFVHFHTRLRGICNLQSMVIFIPFGSSDTRIKCPYCRHDRKGVINLINLKSLTNLTSYFVRLLEKKDIIYLYINIINKVRVFFFSNITHFVSQNTK